MALRPAICSQCGGNIEVDDANEKGFCPYCGAQYYTEKIINNTYVTHNYKGAVINVQGADVNNYLKLATTFIEQNNYEKALQKLDDALTSAPDDYRVWLMIMQVRLKMCDPLKDIPSKLSLVNDVFLKDIDEALKAYNEALNKATNESEYEDSLKSLYTELDMLQMKNFSIMTENQKRKDSKLPELGNSMWMQYHRLYIASILIYEILGNPKSPNSILDTFFSCEIERTSNIFRLQRIFS